VAFVAVDINRYKVIIDVERYDQATSTYNLLDWYRVFNDRIEALGALADLYGPEEFTYSEFILMAEKNRKFIIAGMKDAGHSYEQIDRNLKCYFGYEDYPPTMQDFINYKERYAKETEQEFMPLVKNIINGVGTDNILPISLYRLDNAIPVKSIDMKTIAWRHRTSSFDGMDNEKHNLIIARAITHSLNIEDYKTLEEIPRGYGWENNLYFQNKKIAWAEVDLSAPDFVLLDAFKNWIIETREDINQREKLSDVKLVDNHQIKKSNIKKWHSMRVIPFLDLKILTCYEKVQLTMKQIGDIIYPDEFDIDTTEKVRKTLSPLVNDIMNYKYLDMILKQATAERHAL